ncbi:hypothetical protein GCM10009865_14360 [Aeromicrobium ponti]|uniref:Lipoprotein n=1 Tax=Cytobacillus oceanisediminis TaxID=665099 RepID=A0A562K0F7_9BACI|nr:hypothetical protein [Cytobacillus oceanisediminis]TWH88909.1 hypothetical protein IQ19_01329 [Cytobacillus oceanisediminis]
MKKVSFLFLIILVIITGCSSSPTKVEEDNTDDYEIDLQKVVSLMLTQSVSAEEMIGIYSEVWSTSIDITIDDSAMASILNIEYYDVPKYFKSDDRGYIAFQGNFEKALSKTQYYFKKPGKSGEIESNREEVTELIKKLNDPPEKYKDAYDIAFEMYSLYEKYITFALSPSGSLMTYNQEANKLSSDLVTKVKEFEVKMPVNKGNDE